MDLSQTKLIKDEWEAMERRVSANEHEILKLIQNGYNDINLRYNNIISLLGLMKIENVTDAHHHHFYMEYFDKKIGKLIKKYQLEKMKKKKKKKNILKKKDLIRIKNIEDKMDKKKVFEFILIKLFEKFLKKGDAYHYYTVSKLLKLDVFKCNTYLTAFIKRILESKKMDKSHIIKDAKKIMEQNTYLNKFKDITLYDHQKRLFYCCKQPGPKLILYKAPTGTGKTLSPIGLSQGHKLIFVCAAKHVGMQLARSCVSMMIPIAVAFGCNDPGDIRLHYYAAKDFVKNRRTGGIFRVDNAVGDKVQIIISDIKSYLSAMRYMLAFNPSDEVILYWDEPTITLDYDTHEYHDILAKNWEENLIPNVILSSATLPDQSSIEPFIRSHHMKFPSTAIHNISSYHFKKTIQMIDESGNIVLPHFVFEKYEDVLRCVEHISRNKTIMRYFDIGNIGDFISYVDPLLPDRYKIDMQFENISDITPISIKEHYINILSKLGDKYTPIYEYFKDKNGNYQSIANITTSDAYTLTNGPTIYICDDVDQMADKYIEEAQIPKKELDNILSKINANSKIRAKLKTLEKNYQKKADKDEKYEDDSSASTMEAMYNSLYEITMNSKYIPNSTRHLEKWGHPDEKHAFRGTIPEDIVEKITLLKIDEKYKVLLLMGIGVFKKDMNTTYLEIIKKLADDENLFMILASSDYIYGTNYQFCHGYVGNEVLTQEKMIQAFGRIGRFNLDHEYSVRLRDNALIEKMLLPSENHQEADNMNRLFGI